MGYKGSAARRGEATDGIGKAAVVTLPAWGRGMIVTLPVWGRGMVTFQVVDKVHSVVCVHTGLAAVALFCPMEVSGQPCLRLLGFSVDTRANLLSSHTQLLRFLFLLCLLQFTLCPYYVALLPAVPQSSRDCGLSHLSHHLAFSVYC